MYQVSFWSATTTVFPSADPFSSMTFASSSIASRADFARGKITSNIAASGRPSALRGSFASTFLFGIAVTMIAGSGATFEESFGIPTWLCALIMTVVIYLTLLLDFNKIVRALGFVTPFLIVMVVLIAIYYLFAGSISISKVNSTVDHPSLFLGIIFDAVSLSVHY